MAKAESGPPKAKKSQGMFVDYITTIEFTRRLCGTVPEDEKSQDAFIKSMKIPPDEADQAKINMFANAAKPCKESEIDEEMEVSESSLTFLKNDKGLYLSGHMFKAMIKEAAVLLDYTAANNPGRQYFQHGVSIREECVQLGVEEPCDPPLTQYGVVFTRQGQRAIVTRRRYVEPGCRVVFTARCLVGKNFLDRDKFRALLCQGKEGGMGSARAQGNGAFKVIEIREREVDIDVPEVIVETAQKKIA